MSKKCERSHLAKREEGGEVGGIDFIPIRSAKELKLLECSLRQRRCGRQFSDVNGLVT